MTCVSTGQVEIMGEPNTKLRGQLTFAAINDVAIKHTQAHRTVDEKRALLGQLKLS